MLGDRPADQTLLAWCGTACVGVATLGIRGTDSPGMGVLIEDAWQRRGLGTTLVASLDDRARLGGVTTVHADVLTDDRFILDILRRVGALAVSLDSGAFSIDVDLRTRPCLPRGVGPIRPDRLPLFGANHPT